MSKRIILFFPVLVFMFSFHSAYAGIVINEIMYDLKTGSDDGREWIEIYNDADTAVDISTFKFFEADTNHKLVLVQGDANIPAKNYAVVVSDFAKFKTDWPNFSGIILDSSFSFSNTGESLALKNAELTVDEYTYQSSFGGAGDGKSLQKINGAWVGAVPTLGVENKIVFVQPPARKSAIVEKSISKKVFTEQKTPAQETTKEIINEERIPISDLPSKNKSYLLLAILIIFLGIAGGAVYFIRQKKNVSNAGDDFEILDE